MIELNLCFLFPFIFGPNISPILSMFLRLPLRIRSHCLFVFHGPTFNALLPLCSIDNNLVRLFCLLPPLYPEFLINSTFHSFGSLMPKTWKVEDQHDRGFQRWILTTERFCGAADNIIARMEPGRHSRLFIHHQLAVQIALLSRAISPSKPCKQCCARHRVTSLLFSGSTASRRGRTPSPPSELVSFAQVDSL